MPLYENIYITPDSPEWQTCVKASSQINLSGYPDITLTWVKDREHGGKKIDHNDFENTIVIGEQVYMESLNRLAFHNGLVKLTSVKCNDRAPGRIFIGDYSVLQGTAIIAYEEVLIEQHVVFGPNVTVMDSSGHPLRGRGEDDEASRITSRPVHIKEHAWIGMGAVILKGVTIGKNAVIGAGSVVNSDIPDYGLAVGNPASLIKHLK